MFYRRFRERIDLFDVFKQIESLGDAEHEALRRSLASNRLLEIKATLDVFASSDCRWLRSIIQIGRRFLESISNESNRRLEGSIRFIKRPNALIIRFVEAFAVVFKSSLC